LRKKRFVERLVQNHKPFAEAYEIAFRLRQEVLKIARVLTEDGIDLLLIKPFNDLPIDSDNFDILVKRTDITRARKILEDLGFIELVKIREYKWHGPPHKFLYRRLIDGIVMTIHLHTQVAWEGLIFLDENDIWTKHREIRISGVNLCFPSPEHHILITVAHAFFENKYLKLSDIIYIIENLKFSGEVDWNYIADWALSDHWLKPFYAFLRLADHLCSVLFDSRLIDEEVFDLLAKKGKIGRKQGAGKKLIALFSRRKLLPMKIPLTRIVFQYFEKIFGSPDSSSIEKITEILSLSWSYLKKRIPLIRRRRREPSFLVCFSGQDGTGKTEHAVGLWNKLVARGFKASYVWSRGAGLSIKPFLPIGRLLISGNKLSDESEYIFKRKMILKREPMRTLWTYIMLVDELLQLLIKAKIPLLLGRVVICDRHILDVLVDLRCELHKNVGHITKEIISDLAPKPRIAFVLDTEPKEILRRKEVRNLDLVRCKRHNYLVYCARSKFTLIDTSKEFDQNQKEILSLFMKAGYLG